MREALALAKMGWGHTNPNPMVGAVIVKNGEIIGRGYHARAGEAHAEINALRDAGRRGADVRGSTLYVTLEPCSTTGRTPPCTDAVIAAGIRHVVIGALDPNPRHRGRAVQILADAGITSECGVENDSCNELNRPFFHYITTGKPFVILKMAMTLDGKIATPEGDSKWITGEEARARVQQLRRLADAVMVGATTLQLDHPQLTVREPQNWEPQPLRLIASSELSGEEIAEFFPDGRAERVEPSSPEAWEELLLDLGRRQIMVLLIEGGGELAASALKAGAVDYVEFHIAPKLLGGRDSIPVLGGEAPGSLADALQLHRVKYTQYGDDFAISGFTKEC